MKLTDVQLDAFGVWMDLRLRELSSQCTVFYGPNEAGKTTVLQFIRGVLYGFSAAGRARYLTTAAGDAVGSETAGGALSVIDEEERRLTIRRRHAIETADETVTIERATIESADDDELDSTESDSKVSLRQLLHDVDEPTFVNIFAIGLRELQELGTLDDLEAAKWLYNLTAGLDRVSLSEVLSELENSRARIIGYDGGPSTLARLQQRCAKLREDVAELTGISERFGELLAEEADCRRQISAREQELKEREAAIRVLEAAVLVHDSWQRRELLDAQIVAASSKAAWPADAVARIDRWTAAIRKGRRRQGQLARVIKRLRGEMAVIKPKAAVCDQAARIAALLENESWTVALEQEIGQSAAAVAQLNGNCQAIEKQLQAAGVGGDLTAKNLGGWDDATVQKLRHRAVRLRRALRQAKAERQQGEEQRSAAEKQQRQVDAALATRKQADLTGALAGVGERVAKLRNRLQLDERIERLGNSKTDLEQQIADLMERQILPPWTVIGLGGVFVLGIVLILAGLLLPNSFSGSLGWPMAWLGLLATGSAVAAKFTMERSVAQQLAASRKQVETADAQIKQAKQERDELDRALPKGGGAPAAQLQAAEKELADLEKLLPMEMQRQAAVGSAETAADRGLAARDRLKQAVGRWRAALKSLGLPVNLKPREAHQIVELGKQWASARKSLAEAQENLQRRQRELAVMGTRIDAVFAAANLNAPIAGLGAVSSTSASDRLRQLRRELAEQESLQQQLDGLKRRRSSLRRKRLLNQRRLTQLMARRRRLLRRCHVASVAEFRGRAAEFERVALLQSQRAAAHGEIVSVLTGISSEPAIAGMYAGKTVQQLEAELTAGKQASDGLRRGYRDLLEHAGRLSGQIETLRTDRRLPLKRIELSQAESEYSAALRRWQVLSVVWRVLGKIKEDYEHRRQPETLREASGYLSKFTGGKYRRVWTRLGENVLWVDDDERRTLSIEMLSHGTREQLLLSLRMALVSLLARRGVELPLILDDVLVNFDTQRAARAVETLRDYAQGGRQIVMFTCHEHIAKQCKASKLDVRRLPVERQSGVDQPFELEAEPIVRRARGRRIRDEVALVDLKPIVAKPPPVETTVVAEPVIEPVFAIAVPVEKTPVEKARPARSAINLRVDRPKARRPAPSIMRRWAAEEFSGELDDRVNSLWLMEELAGGVMEDGRGDEAGTSLAEELAALRGVESRLVGRSEASEETSVRDSGASKIGLLRLFSEESTTIVVEPSATEPRWREFEAADGSELSEHNSGR